MRGRSVRRVVAGAAALLAGAALAGEARAADAPSATSGLGIKLPGLEVDLPPVQVKVPSVEVNLTPVEVKVPSVEVKLPPVEVKSPPVEATVPLDVKVPQVQAPAPSRNQDPPAPAAPQAPSGGGSAPTSPSKGEDAPARETAQADAAGPAASGDATTRGGATRGGSTTRRDVTSTPRPAGADRGGDRGRDGRVPPATRRREQRLRQVVQRLSGCLGALPAIETRVLTLRAGGQARPPLTRRQVARRLDVGVPRVAAVERRGLDRLREQARGGGCGEEPAPSAGAAVPTDTGTDEAAAAAPAEPAASAAPRRATEADAGVVEAVKGWLGDEAAPALTPRVLLIRATSPPVLLLLIAAFLIGFGINWVADWRAMARRPASS